jgi:hypothetical protein
MQLTYGSAQSFDALVYGESHPNTVNFLQNQISHVSERLTDAGRMFMDRGRNAFEHFNNSEAMRFARNAVRAAQGIFDTPRIRELSTLEDFTKANLLMQRWAMANPKVRELYHAQRIDGYSDTYQDVHGTVTGDRHYDYRRVTDGLMEFSDEDGWKCTQYVEDLIEGDRDLLFEEQLDITRSWRAMETLIALGKDDPTSQTGGSL